MSLVLESKPLLRLRGRRVLLVWTLYTSIYALWSRSSGEPTFKFSIYFSKESGDTIKWTVLILNLSARRDAIPLVHVNCGLGERAS